MSSTTVNFNLKDAGFANFASQTLTFRLLKAGADKTDDTVILPSVVTATSGTDGTGSVSLFRNGESDIDSVFEVVFPNKERAKFIIPSSSSSIHLSDLLVDHAPSGAATQQSSVYAAAIQRSNHIGTQTLSTISDSGTLQVKPSEGAFVDGDKTKLDGIESNATADQTAAEIRTLVESATDSNVFTDADHTKLDNIDSDITTLSLPASTTISDFSKTVLDDTDGAAFMTTLGITSFAQTFLDDADAAAVKTTLGITDATAQVNFVPRSILFSDENAFLSVADSATIDVGTGDFSLAFWARLDSSASEGVLQKNGTAGFAVKFNSGNLILTLNDSGGSSDFTLASSLNDNKWHVYVITVDRNGNAIAYVDNVAQTGVSVSGKSGNLDNTSAFQIGVVGTDGNAGVSLGNYVALYKSALSASNAGKIYFSRDVVKTAAGFSPVLAVDLRKETETFKDVSSNNFTVTSNGSVTFNEDRLTEFTGTNVLATSTLGYTTGSGGTVTQATSKSTAVTLNKINGEIVMNAAQLNATTTVSFTLNNSTIAATDVVVVNIASVGTVGSYLVTVSAVAAGSCSISVRNITSGNLSQGIKLNFAVIKAVAS